MLRHKVILFLWQFLTHDTLFYDPNVLTAGRWHKPVLWYWLFDIICCLLFKVSTQLKDLQRRVNRMEKRLIKVTEDKGGQTDVNKRKKDSACCCYRSSSSITSPLPRPASIRSLQRHATVHHSCTLMHTPKKTPHYYK